MVEEGPIYELDGARIRTLEDFWTVIGEAVNGPGGYFASNLDALDDALSGGMGQSDDGRCTFVLQNSRQVRNFLSYSETVRQLEHRLQKCHPSNRALVQNQLQQARDRQGPTVFEWLLESFEESPARLVLS